MRAGQADDTLDGLRILVVDDEPDARTLVRRVLAESGALVALAASAREAMEQLARSVRTCSSVT